MEVHPIYVLKAGDETSPDFESTLALFDPETKGPMIEDQYGIPRHRLSGLISPWCRKRHDDFTGDIPRSKVEKIPPSRLPQVRSSPNEPRGDNIHILPMFVAK